jgi:hypothetical protein
MTKWLRERSWLLTRKWCYILALVLGTSMSALAQSGTGNVDWSPLVTLFSGFTGLFLLCGAVLVIGGIVWACIELMGRDHGSGIKGIICALVGGVLIGASVVIANRLTGQNIQPTFQ